MFLSVWHMRFLSSLVQRRARGCIRTMLQGTLPLSIHMPPPPQSKPTQHRPRQTARRMRGGPVVDMATLHGPGSFPDLVTDVASTVTLEGENYVTPLQAARYRYKMVSVIRQGRPVDAPMSYLNEPVLVGWCPPQGNVFLNANVRLCLFCHCAQRLIFKCHMPIEELMLKDHLPLMLHGAHMIYPSLPLHAHILSISFYAPSTRTLPLFIHTRAYRPHTAT